MSRLIDAEPIERVLDNLVKSTTGKSMAVLGYSNALAQIYNAKTVDAVPVTRCKACKHFGPRIEEGSSKGICWAFGAQPASVTDEEDFCSRAEKKDEDGKG